MARSIVRVGTLLLACLGFVSASALPAAALEGEELESRASTSPVCVTVASGNLVTSEVAVGLTRRAGSISHKPFALNEKNEIAFYNTTKPKIFAEFQKCTPNYFGVPNNGKTIYNFAIQYWGRVYIPATKSCIGIENPYLGPNNDNFLYVPKVVPCLNSASGAMGTKASIPQNFAYRNLNGRKEIFFAGSSTYKPPTYQGLCETGLLGYYQWLPSGYPIVGPSNRIQYVCNADSENAVAAAELL